VVGQLAGVEPVVSREEWERLLAIFAGRRRGRPPGLGTYVLSGLVRCARCGNPLYGAVRPNMKPYQDGSARREYRCRTSADSPRACGRNLIDFRIAEEAVGEAVKARLGDPRRADRIARHLAAVRAERDEISAEIAALEESAVVDAWGFTARVALRRGQTVSTVIDRIPAIESGLATRPGAVRIEPDQTRADWLLMRVIERDPHAEPLPFPTRLVESITQPIALGLFEDGQAVEVNIAHRHTLVGGIVGSGKSGVVNIILANLTACADIRVLGVDLKGGMELGPWADCLSGLATTTGEAAELLHDMVAELDRRAGDLAVRGERLWVPRPEAPALVVVIDEYAELGEDAKELADSIARRGRAVAVTLVVATQRPTQKAMGNSAVRAQMDVRVCLRVRERRDVDLILGQGMHAAGWHAHNLDVPGKFLISSPEHTIPKRARAYHITDHDVTATARANSARRSAPRADAQTAPGVVPKPRTPTEDRAGTAPADPDTALWVALRNAPESGVTLAELITATGMSRRWVYYRLQQHARSGRVYQAARGRWRAQPTGS
jgi:S-DNA-T family DNA segregation ATPase FtsK/SpoIIIE